MKLKTFLGDSKLKSKLRMTGQNSNINSSGGYNDFFLNFLQETFSIKIKKSHSFFSHVIHAIDFLNSNTEDCFFDLPGHDISFLHTVGKSII